MSLYNCQLSIGKENILDLIDDEGSFDFDDSGK